MTDYERTTVRESTTVDPAAPPAYVDPAAPPAQASSVRTTERAYVTPGPSGLTTAARVITFLFGILQAALILNITDPFVDPFRGMFSIDRVTAGESKFDVAALVALIGWTLVEALLLAALRIFARRPADAV